MADKGFTPENVALSGSILGSMGAETLKKIQKDFVEQHPHHIPMLFMLDIINGFKTIFPIPLGQGATFEPELSEKCAAVAAKEARNLRTDDRPGPRCKMGPCHGVYR
jgi:beta-glucosidase